MAQEPETRPPVLTEAEREQIAAALRKAQVVFDCPMCHNKAFTILDGYTNFALTVQLGMYDFGGRSLPIALIVCNRCGFISQHALGALGLLPKGESK